MRGLDVLVVDDDPDMLLVLAEVLQRAGHSVRGAGNGQQALDLMVNGWRPQLILLDMVMPVMDGFAFLRRKEAIRELEKIPVLVISATAASPIEGARHVLCKPVEPADLVAAVKTYSSAHWQLGRA